MSGAAGSAGSGGAAPCLSGTAFCVGAILKVCKGDGSTNDTKCDGATPFCDAANNECDTCLAGSATCNGAVLRVCNTDGKGTTDTTCDSPAQCSSSLAKCLPLGSVSAVSAGGRHTCALMQDQSVKCWGSPEGFNGGTQNVLAPVTVQGLPPMKRVSSGGTTTCGLADDDSAWCWGKPPFAGGASQTFQVKPAPVLDIVASAETVCVLVSPDLVECAGYNDQCQLGDGSCTGGSKTLKPVPGLSGVAQIASSAWSQTTCARLNDKSVKCWGRPLENDGTNFFSTPQLVPGVTDAQWVGVQDKLLGAKVSTYVVFIDSLQTLSHVEIKKNHTFGPVLLDKTSVAQAAAGHGLCARQINGVLWCGDTRSALKDVGYGPGDVSAVTEGGGHRCVLRSTGALECWGANGYGQLGVGHDLAVRSAHDVGVTGATRLTRSHYNGYTTPFSGGGLCPDGASSRYSPAGAILQGGFVVGWDYQQPTATSLPDWGIGNDWVSFRTSTVGGSGHSAVDGLYAQSNSTRTPVGVTAIEMASNAGGGELYLRADGTVACKSSSSYKLCGVMLPVTGTLYELPIAGATGLSEGRGACAWGAPNLLKCWGDTPGDGSDSSLLPVTPNFGPTSPTISGAVALPTDGGYCAVADGRIYCWGYEQPGSKSKYPLEVAGTAGALGIAAGRKHFCSWFVGGAVRCWGENQFGQVGSGSLAPSFASPQAVAGISGEVVEVVASEDSTCARTAAGRVYCWGYALGGGIGNGWFANEPKPLTVGGL